MFCSTHENCPPHIHSGRSLSNQVESGSVLFQPCYWDEVSWYGHSALEAAGAEWPNKEQKRAIRDLEERWQIWRDAKDLLDADFRKVQLERLKEIAKEIDAGKQKTDFELLEKTRAEHYAADLAANQQYVDEMAALLQQKRASDHAARIERANKAGREIARSRAKAERKILRARGVLR
jgi:hypothetical protein